MSAECLELEWLRSSISGAEAIVGGGAGVGLSGERPRTHGSCVIFANAWKLAVQGVVQRRRKLAGHPVQLGPLLYGGQGFLSRENSEFGIRYWY